jgi:hypothetical protein
MVFAAVMTGVFVGATLQRVLPEHHLGDDSKDMVKIGAGFIATLSALVLGLLVSSATASFNAKSDEVEQSSAKIVLLDRNLRQYGDEATPVRLQLRDALVARAKITWVEHEAQSATQGAVLHVPPELGIERIRTRIAALTPSTAEQRSLQTASLALVDQLTQTRWLLIEQSTAEVSTPLLVVMVFWLATFAGCLALYAPRNGTVLAVSVCCALTVSGAIFLIVEMYDPFRGMMKISDAPIRVAIDYLSQ